MNPRTTKEIRTLLPFLAVAALAPLAGLLLVAFWPKEVVLSWTLFCSAMASVAMGVVVFGDEFSNRTMSLLLAQPMPRAKIWRGKMGVLFGAVVVSSMAMLLALAACVGSQIRPEEFCLAGGVLFAFAAGVYCTTPFWTLAIKNVLGAVGASLSAPIFLIGVSDAFMEHFFPQWSWAGGSRAETWLVAPMIGAYFGFCYWVGRTMFLELEVIDSRGREIALPERLQPLFAPLWQALTPGHGGPLRSLITKELYLQRVSFGMAVIFSGVFFLGAASWKLSKFEWATTAATVIMATSFALNFLLNSFIAGGVCVAEERNWGTLGSQLMLPPSRSLQWVVKVTVAIGTSLLLGVFVPLALYLACKSWFHFPSDAEGVWKAMVVMYPLLMGLNIYTSSLTSSTMRAVIMASALLVAAGTVVPLAVEGGRMFAESTAIYTAEMLKGQILYATIDHDAGKFIFVVILALIALLIYLGFVNFREAEVSQRRKWMQPAGLVLGIGVVSFVVSFLINTMAG